MPVQLAPQWQWARVAVSTGHGRWQAKCSEWGSVLRGMAEFGCLSACWLCWTVPWHLLFVATRVPLVFCVCHRICLVISITVAFSFFFFFLAQLELFSVRGSENLERGCSLHFRGWGELFVSPSPQIPGFSVSPALPRHSQPQGSCGDFSWVALPSVFAWTFKCDFLIFFKR